MKYIDREIKKKQKLVVRKLIVNKSVFSLRFLWKIMLLKRGLNITQV